MFPFVHSQTQRYCVFCKCRYAFVADLFVVQFVSQCHTRSNPTQHIVCQHYSCSGFSPRSTSPYAWILFYLIEYIDTVIEADSNQFGIGLRRELDATFIYF